MIKYDPTAELIQAGINEINRLHSEKDGLLNELRECSSSLKYLLTLSISDTARAVVKDRLAAIEPIITTGND